MGANEVIQTLGWQGGGWMPVGIFFKYKTVKVGIDQFVAILQQMFGISTEPLPVVVGSQR